MKTIFVSSTFADMQRERDILRDHVAARINAMARQWNDHIEFCDLRWGINTENMESESASRKVLDVCLDEIDRSSPPMIILLGDRYGWIPDKELVLSVAEKKKMLLDDFRKSATALEAEYGTTGRKISALVYIRRILAPSKEVPGEFLAEDEEHQSLLDTLKDRLEALPNCRVRQYSVRFEDGEPAQEDILQFAETVAEDLEQALRPDWEKFAGMTAFERERERQWTFIREKSTMFSARQADLEALMARIRGSRQTVVCKGAPGSGKSTLTSMIALKARDEGWDVVPFIGGLTHESNDAADVLRNTVYYLEERLQKPHQSEMTDDGPSEFDPVPREDPIAQWQNRLKELAGEYEKTGRKMLVIVDAVDQLFPDEVRDSCGFIPAGLSKSIRFFLSALPDTEIPEKSFYALNPLTEDDRKRVMDGVLRRFGKELSPRVREHLLKLRAADNPYYVSMAVQRLCMMEETDFEAAKASGAPGIVALGDRQIEILDHCPPSVEKMCVEIFSVAAKRINPGLLADAASFLAASRYGLRRGDLAALLGDKWNELDFSHFLNYLYEDFQIRTDGRIDFMHKTIRRGLRWQFAGNARYDKKLADYLGTLDPHDPFRMDEQPYHLKWGEDVSGFLDYIDRHELGENKDREIIRHAAATMKDVCLEDDGDFMAEALERSMEGNRWASLLWFGLKELNDTFGRRFQEEGIKARLLAEYKKTYEALDQQGRISERNREIFGKEISDQIVENWYRISDRKLLDWAGETKLAIAKRMYGGNSLEQRSQLFDSYYNVLFAYKGASDKSMLQKGLRIAEEGEKLLDDDLLRYMEDHGSSAGSPFFGCMGEIYMRLDDNEKCLETYQRDLEIRRRLRGKDPDSAQSLLTLSGAYGNVAMAHSLFDEESHYAAAYEAICSEIACLEKAGKLMGGTAVFLGTNTTGYRYYRAAVLYLQKARPLVRPEDHKIVIDNDEAVLAVRRLIIGWDLQKEAFRRSGDPKIAREAEDCLRILLQCALPEDLQEETVKVLRKWAAADEEDAFEKDDQYSIIELLKTYHYTASFIAEFSVRTHYDLALECCKKRIALVEKEEVARRAGWDAEAYRKELSDAYYMRGTVQWAMDPGDITPLKENLACEEELSKKYGSPSERLGDLYGSYARHCLTQENEPLVPMYCATRAIDVYRKLLETADLSEKGRDRIRWKLAAVHKDFSGLAAEGRAGKDYCQLIQKTVKKMDAEHRPRLAQEVPESILQNAVSSYARGVALEDIVAINAGGTFSRGKNGVLYTAKALYSSELDRGSSIPYSEIKNVYRYGDKLRFWMKDGTSVIVDFGVYNAQIYHIVMKLLQ
ncbi:MAG: DUF4062 domain-containing protein [Lachnospiraceae bacterium]|nr:DUF4062 domain-containing protein [Lachnospiraceae bacterium]